MPRVALALLLARPTAAAWERMLTWCFPTHPPVPLTEEMLKHYNSFDMVDLCAPGVVRDEHRVPLNRNVTETSRVVAEQILKDKPDQFVSPYLGFEIGQSYYEAQHRFNTEERYSHMWLRYANGSVVTCNPQNPSTLELCALAQSAIENPEGGNKVYDWRVPGAVDFFVNEVALPYYKDPLFKGIFFDDIYTICDIVSYGSLTGDFKPGEGETFCAAAMAALRRVSEAGVKLGKLPILSVKGDERDDTAFNMTAFSEILLPGGKGGSVMAYFEFWAMWEDQPRSESILQYAMSWGAAGVPMQMHSSLGAPYRCGGGPSATLEQNKSITANYTIANFLLAANERSYFSIGNGWNPNMGQALRLPEYDRKLGKPAGPARQVAPHVYERHFEHVSVHLNMSDCSSVRVEWREGSGAQEQALLVA